MEIIQVFLELSLAEIFRQVFNQCCHCFDTYLKTISTTSPLLMERVNN